MTDASRDLIYLVSAAVNGTVPDESRVRAMDMDALYAQAGRHMLSAAAAVALEAAGVEEPRFNDARGNAIRKIILLDADRARVLDALEKAGIRYMPLKGIVLKDYYPEIGMRQMTDNDIFFDRTRAADVKEIMESLGFTAQSFGRRHHDIYVRPPVSNFEMHRDLNDDSVEEELSRYYQAAEEKLLKDPDNGFGYHFRQEDFYIYMIAHEYKHYRLSGTGLRSLLDTYVFLKRAGASMDWDYVRREVRENGTETFEKQNRELAMKVFASGEPELTEEEEELLTAFAVSGSHGTHYQRVRNDIRKNGRLKYLMGRLFLPMDEVRAFFPAFYRHKALLAFLPLYRLLRKGNRTKAEIKAFFKNDR